MKSTKQNPYAMILAVLMSGIGLAGAATTAGQPTAKELAQNLKKACQSDIKQYCSDVTPGSGRIMSCLQSKQDKLSPECRTSWSNTEANISRRMDKADVAFRKSCGSDVQKFCADVPSGKGRILECLNENRDQLSQACSKFQTKLDEKLSEFVG